jgi:hypothetical protein
MDVMEWRCKVGHTEGGGLEEVIWGGIIPIWRLRGVMMEE